VGGPSSMTREDILQFALDAAKDDYLRGQGRLGLVETKAQLISATVGILLAFLAAIPFTDIPHSEPWQIVGLVLCVVALVISLIWSLAASFLVDVRPPQSAAETSKQCQDLIGKPGDTGKNVDAVATEHMIGNICGTYQVATAEVLRLLKKRMASLRVAQLTLIVGIALMIVLIGIPDLARACDLLKAGLSCHG
jgi:hypothetical protein